MSAKKSLGELLVRENIIDLQQLDLAKKDQKAQGGRLPTALVRLGYVTEKQLTEFFSQQYGVQPIDLSNFEIDPELVKLVSRQVCEKHVVLPVMRAGKNLVVAFADPSNIYVKDDIALLTRSRIEVVVASESSIMSAIEKYYGGSASSIANLVSQIEDAEEGAVASSNVEVVDQDGDVEEGPIVKFVNTLLADAIKSRTSDIHIEPYEKRFRVRFRIDGSLVEKTQPPPGAASAIVSRIKILAKMDISERRKPQDGRIKVRLRNGREVDFRVNCLPTIFGEKVVLRILDRSSLNVDLARIGFEADDFEIFREAIHRPQGMILITGPTGSGKTTTIYSALNELNQSDVNLSTAEDPVEYNLDGINQVQVYPQIGFTFAEALRAFLRQDPEIIMVGEIRDLETAEVAYKAASTGHLVVSTLHTNDAAATVSRLVEMGIEPYVVAEATTIVVAQRLLRRNCTRCLVEHKVAPDVLLRMGVSPSVVHEYNNLKRGEGCDDCGGAGLKGRMAIFELMRMTASVKEAVFKNSSPLEIKRCAIERDKMRTLRQSALLKAKAGLTTLDEVLNTTVADDV